MNKQKKITLGVIILAVLLMGVGYAAITNVTLTINGKATATASQENFKVYYTAENSTVTNEAEGVEVSVTAKAQNATVNFSGMTTKGDSKQAILEIENGSNDVDASSVNVKAEATGTSTEIIKVSSEMCDKDGNAIADYAVASGEKTYVKVTAELLQTPTEDVETTITATIEAVAKEVK